MNLNAFLRGLRTFFQTLIASVLVAVTNVGDSFNSDDVSVNAAVVVLVAVVAGVLGWLLNIVRPETKAGVPSAPPDAD